MKTALCAVLSIAVASAAIGQVKTGSRVYDAYSAAKDTLNQNAEKMVDVVKKVTESPAMRVQELLDKIRQGGMAGNTDVQIKMIDALLDEIAELKAMISDLNQASIEKSRDTYLSSMDMVIDRLKEGQKYFSDMAAKVDGEEKEQYVTMASAWADWQKSFEIKRDRFKAVDVKNAFAGLNRKVQLLNDITTHLEELKKMISTTAGDEKAVMQIEKIAKGVQHVVTSIKTFSAEVLDATRAEQIEKDAKMLKPETPPPAQPRK